MRQCRVPICEISPIFQWWTPPLSIPSSPLIIHPIREPIASNYKHNFKGKDTASCFTLLLYILQEISKAFSKAAWPAWVSGSCKLARVSDYHIQPLTFKTYLKRNGKGLKNLNKSLKPLKMSKMYFKTHTKSFQITTTKKVVGSSCLPELKIFIL